MRKRRLALKLIASGALVKTLAETPVRAADTVRSSAFGVKGDGTSNDRVRLQAAIDASVDKTLVIDGRCRIDAKGLDLRSGSRVRFEPGASIKLLAHNTPFYQIIRIWDVTNVVLDNAALDGSKELNAATPKRRDEGYGMGISIAGSTNVTVRSAVTTGCWGDGVYIANSYRSPHVPPEDIRLIEHRASDCRRQGVSIISGRNITLERCTWQNIAGTAPSAGLDIEPNSNRDVLENIRVVDPVTRNCKIGILVFLAEIPGPLAKHVDITISGHRDEGSSDNAFSVSGLDTKGFIVKGRVESRSPTWIDSRLASVENVDYDKRGPTIVVTGLRLIR